MMGCLLRFPKKKLIFIKMKERTTNQEQVA